LYVSGWIKRGATGVLGTNKPDSRETIETLLEDLPKLKECPNRTSETLKTLLSERNIRVITFDDWKKIDAEEIKRGQEKNKPREKFTSTQSIIEFLDN
jgi:ferredoxin--NADP+ reductase